MQKKIFWGVVFFFGLSLFFMSPVSAAVIEVDKQVELGSECQGRRCIIPVPTLVRPDGDVLEKNDNFYLTGLTWNHTEIDVYVDDQYLGEAVVVDDEGSNTANFYYLVENHSLWEGDHHWQVIAWSETGWERSRVSREVLFRINVRPLAPVIENVFLGNFGRYFAEINFSEEGQITKIYVDGTLMGRVDDRFTEDIYNYDLGILSPGLHAIFAITEDRETGEESYKSNIFSLEVPFLEAIDFTENQSIPAEIFPELEEVQPIITEEAEKIEVEPEILEPEEIKDENISAISEEKEVEEIIVKAATELGEVNITESTEATDSEVAVVSSESTEQVNLIADDGEGEKDNLGSEIQPAEVDSETEEEIIADLDFSEKQARNRKLGIWLLVVLSLVLIFSNFFSKRKNQKNSANSKENPPQQKNLFDD